MLPSMPVLFNRDSQDAFGNKIEPSTSAFGLFKQIQIAPQILERPTVQKIEIEKTKIVEKKQNKRKEQNDIVCVSCNEDQEAAFVSAYYRKIRSRFPSNSGKASIFTEFQEIIKSFDASKESPTQLYKKLEVLFGDGNKDLTEEFLLFLTSEQAAELGKFMDHFMVTKMSDFLKQLHTTFSHKPTALRKTLKAITSSLNCDNFTEMKATVLPHLRTSPRLTQMFRSLFPDERPPDSLYDSNMDMINESFLADDKGYDVWEFDDSTESRRNLSNKEDIDTTYLQGRVFLQHRKMLRPARVTFPYSKEPYRWHARRLAPAQSRLTPSDSDDDTKRSKNNIKKEKKTKKTKSIKDVNDNKQEVKLTDSPKAKKTDKKLDKVEADKKGKSIKIKKVLKPNVNGVEHKKTEGTKSKQAKIDSKKQHKDSNWTRDEDKAMLQILQEEAATKRVLDKISKLLPHRSMPEIRERYNYVTNVLQQMALSEIP